MKVVDHQAKIVVRLAALASLESKSYGQECKVLEVLEGRAGQEYRLPSVSDPVCRVYNMRLEEIEQLTDSKVLGI